MPSFSFILSCCFALARLWASYLFSTTAFIFPMYFEPSLGCSLSFYLSLLGFSICFDFLSAFIYSYTSSYWKMEGSISYYLLINYYILSQHIIYYLVLSMKSIENCFVKLISPMIHCIQYRCYISILLWYVLYLFFVHFYSDQCRPA